MELIQEFFHHNSMMNGRIISACRDLTAGQLDATATGTYGSIGATLVHIANAQESYAARLLDGQRPDRLPEHPFPGLAALAERMADGDSALELAVAQSDVDREVVVTGDDPPGSWTMPVGLFLLQAINHGTEHRSQIATILTQLGIEPPNMDGWTYIEASGQLIPV